jgi:hypothetical protein
VTVREALYELLKAIRDPVSVTTAGDWPDPMEEPDKALLFTVRSVFAVAVANVRMLTSENERLELENVQLKLELTRLGKNKEVSLG